MVGSTETKSISSSSKNELLGLEKLLSAIPLNQRKDDRASLVQSIKQESERVMQMFALNAITFHNESQLARYIQYHQYAIVQLMDKLSDAMSLQKPMVQNDCVPCRDCLEELLSFIEHNFSTYFDQDVKAPTEHIALAKKEAQESYKEIETAFSDKNIEPHLAALVFRVMRKISEKNAVKKITYRRLRYAKEIQREVFRLLKTEGIKDYNEELRQILYYLNYNSVHVLIYHTRYVAALLNETETRIEKIEKLSFLLKKINQVHIKPNVQYHKHGHSLKEQLSNYISEELQYHERMQLLSTNTSAHTTEPLLQGFKMKFTMSVAQMAYLLKILIETKIIVNDNISQILHFIVKHSVTKRSETISHSSIRSKYYDVESGTKESVRNMLMSLIRHIDKN